MSAAKDQSFESQLQNLECVDDDDITARIEGNILVDADGNYYYQSSASVVKVESIQQLSGTPPKKVLKAEDERDSAKKPNIHISKIEKICIGSEIGNQEKVFEFDENEQDPDDPQKLQIQDYSSKGIIKKEDKKSKPKDLSSFPCMICSYKTNKKFLLSRHLKTHCDERPYKCDVCERGFKTNAALMNHRNIHLGRKPHACVSCDMAFTTSGELVRHVRYRHTHIKPHKCSECDYSSVEMSKLRRHMRCHTGERPYQCPHCTYASPDTFKLKRHMRIHTGEKPYECDICHARFTQSNSLKHHRLIHSVNEKPVFQCNLCPTTCGRKNDLRIHIKNLHSSDHTIPCKRCGKELPDRYSYKMHIKSHEGEKCFRCEYCPYASISQRHLDTHMLIHLDEKPFICEICQTSFRQKQLLVRHTKIYHSHNYKPPKQRIKDHECPYCNKMFAFNGNLIRHMEIHDPDLQRDDKKKQVKIGRLKHLKENGTDVTVTSPSKISNLFVENEQLFYDETKEEQQVENEEMQEEYFEETEVYDEENIQFVFDEYEADEYQEQIEGNQYEKQNKKTKEKLLITNVKQENIQSMFVNENFLKTDIIVKVEEKTDSDTMVLEDQDDEDFMVIEVLPDDEDNDEQQQEETEILSLQNQQAKPIIIKETANTSKNKTPSKNSQSLISDYFGFEVNVGDDDEETKGAIKLLEMIEQE